MSGANETVTADEVQADEAKADHEAHIKVLTGNPTDEDMAVLMAVLGATAGGVERVRRDRNLWGHPADKLRYSIFSWQRVTLLERTHIRR
ncbi:acyl-CoA carboxylase subunit epsilon [Mycobacterium sp. 155]|uniref:acyl-CoA carboxylase subunit epsilon n=1 Tax=Mycobacterium sp. 155 TaxID=1157943 RepID=UPI000363E0BC|nr:acyl-CoA carboxylase subunit epsilon [Mycobacterium sp. 155]